MYNRKDAVHYAHIWWNKRNPNFPNFDGLGGDCTNFISQCLYVGGIQMLTSQKGWFCHSLSNRSPSWSGVNEFFSFATSNSSSFGVRAKQVAMQDLEIGDVIQLRQNKTHFNHSLLVTKISNPASPSGIFVTCHTIDSIDRPLDDYLFQDIRYLKILN